MSRNKCGMLDATLWKKLYNGELPIGPPNPYTYAAQYSRMYAHYLERDAGDYVPCKYDVHPMVFAGRGKKKKWYKKARALGWA